MGKKELVKRNAVEIINEAELDKLLRKKGVVAYCGYEPSGAIHLGHLITLMKLMDLQKAGIKIRILLADWHAWLNRKGDWSFINREVKKWKGIIKAMGLNAEFVIGSDFQKKSDYLEEVFVMAKETTINRGLRSMQTVARDVEHARISQTIYPLMQVEDIKKLNADIVVGGLDQRKIHVLATELFKTISVKKKIVFIHTPILPSILGPGAKMSCSEPGSLISVSDSETAIRKKISKAWCKEGEIKENPILATCKMLLFPKFEKIIVKRSKEHGGDVVFSSYPEMEKQFIEKKLHPADLKNSTADYIIKLLKAIKKKR